MSKYEYLQQKPRMTQRRKKVLRGLDVNKNIVTISSLSNRREYADFTPTWMSLMPFILSDFQFNLSSFSSNIFMRLSPRFAKKYSQNL